MKKFIFYCFCVILFLSFYSVAYGIDNSIDTDGDGISDYDEMHVYHTNTDYYDTDGDGYDDKKEIINNYSPRHANGRKLADVDSDNDGLNDKWELAINSDLFNGDTDGDSYPDGMEVKTGFNPLKNAGTKSQKLIKVDLKTQNLTYLFDDKLLESFAISSGISVLPTPQGEYTILDKVPAKNYGGTGYNYYYPNTKWNMHFTSRHGYRYYIHGAYWHNNFGQPMSHGCINVAYENIERLYNWTSVGTEVVIN